MFKDKQKRIIFQSIIVAILVMIYVAKVRQLVAEPKTIKNVIIMIGDGMGVQEISLLNAYAKYAPDSVYKERGRKTALEKAMQIGSIGFVYTESADVLVTDTKLTHATPAAFAAHQIHRSKENEIAVDLLNNDIDIKH